MNVTEKLFSEKVFEIEPCLPLTLVKIEPGSFTMGNDFAVPDQKPAHNVKITRPFWVGKYQVTQEQYQAVCGYNPASFKHPDSILQPVENVSWYDAVNFCNLLSKKFEFEPCYHNQNGETEIQVDDIVFCNWENIGFRLPTEAEWEFVCRAGTQTIFSFGNEIRLKEAWCYNNSRVEYLPAIFDMGVHNVGECDANPWGCYDMHGNTFEWCWDWYKRDFYSDRPENDPRGPQNGDTKVIRGGSFQLDPSYLESAARASSKPEKLRDFVGLRVLLQA